MWCAASTNAARARARRAATRLQLCWLYVHQHVRDTRVALLDRAFYSMRDLVTLMDGNVAIHSGVEIDVKIQPHFSGATFLNFEDARNRAGN